MYDSVSQLFIALLVVGYFVVFAALTWWALGLPLWRAAKKIAALTLARARRTVRLSAVHSKARDSSTATRNSGLALFFVLIVGGSRGLAQAPDSSRSQQAEASIEGVVTVNDQGQLSAIPGARLTLTATSLTGSEI